MITEKECAFLCRVILGILTVGFILLWIDYGFQLAAVIVYPMIGLISFFIHSGRLQIRKLSLLATVYLILFLGFGFFIAFYSAVKKQSL